MTSKKLSIGHKPCMSLSGKQALTAQVMGNSVGRNGKVSVLKNIHENLGNKAVDVDLETFLILVFIYKNSTCLRMPK